MVVARGPRRCPRRRWPPNSPAWASPKSAIWETKLVTPAKVEKLKWEATKAGEKVQKQLSERQLKTLDTEYVAKVAGKLTVVP